MPQVFLGDCRRNADEIIRLARGADASGAAVTVFPELSVTGYTCGDLFHQTLLLQSASDAVTYIADATKELDTLIFVGTPAIVGDALYNCAAAIRHGRLLSLTPKTYLPNYNEFYEKRWFAPAPGSNTWIAYAGFGDVPFGRNMLLRLGDVKIGVELCEDLWSPLPPSARLALAGAEIIVNLSASDSLTGKYAYLKELVKGQSASLLCAYVYCSAGWGESTTDMVFESKGIIASNGRIMADRRFWKPGETVRADIDLGNLRRDRMHTGTFADTARNELREREYMTVDCGEISARNISDGSLLTVDPLPFVPSDAEHRRQRCLEILEMQSVALARRLEASRSRTAVIGISGGLDSTLALIVTTMAFDFLGRDRKDIYGVTMPGFGTTARTHSNASELTSLLGCTPREVSIAQAVDQHFKDIGHNPEIHDVTYENSQARERTQILMDLSNRLGGIVVGTGDMSELALGWATYNGDHISMYGVNAGVPKTLVKYLVETYADNIADAPTAAVLRDIVATPISPELLPPTKDGEIDQKTEDLVGPYELHDFFLYHTLRHGETPEEIFALAKRAFDGRFDAETIKKWLRTFYRRFFAQQFKRSCLPDGPKIGSVCLSPRGDWRMPSDASSSLWLAMAEKL